MIEEAIDHLPGSTMSYWFFELNKSTSLAISVCLILQVFSNPSVSKYPAEAGKSHYINKHKQDNKTVIKYFETKNRGIKVTQGVKLTFSILAAAFADLPYSFSREAS